MKYTLWAISFLGIWLSLSPLLAQTTPSPSSTASSSPPFSKNTKDQGPSHPSAPAPKTSSESFDQSLQALQQVLQELQKRSRQEEDFRPTLQNPTGSSSARIEAQKEAQLKALQKLRGPFAGTPNASLHFQTLPISNSPSPTFPPATPQNTSSLPIVPTRISIPPTPFGKGEIDKSTASRYHGERQPSSSGNISNNSNSSFLSSFKRPLDSALSRDRANTTALLQRNQTKDWIAKIGPLLRRIFTEMIRRDRQGECRYIPFTDGASNRFIEAVKQGKRITEVVEDFLAMYESAISPGNKNYGACTLDYPPEKNLNRLLCRPLCALATQLVSLIDQMGHAKPFDPPPSIDNFTHLESEVHLLAQPLHLHANNPNTVETLCAMASEAAHNLGIFQELSESDRSSLYQAYVKRLGVSAKDQCPSLLSHHVPSVPSDLTFQSKDEIRAEKLQTLWNVSHVSPQAFLKSLQEDNGFLQYLLTSLHQVQTSLSSLANFSTQFLAPALTFQGCDALIQSSLPAPSSSPLCQGKSTLADCLGLTQNTQGIITLSNLYPQKDVSQLIDQTISLQTVLRSLLISTNPSEAVQKLSAFIPQYLSLEAAFRSQALETPLATYSVVLETLQNQESKQLLCSSENQTACHTCLLSMASLFRDQIQNLFPKELTDFESTLPAGFRTHLLSELKTFQAIPILQESLSDLSLLQVGLEGTCAVVQPDVIICSLPSKENPGLPNVNNDSNSFFSCLEYFRGLGLWLTAYQETLNRLACSTSASFPSFRTFLQTEAQKQSIQPTPYQTSLTRTFDKLGINQQRITAFIDGETNSHSPSQQTLADLVVLDAHVPQCKISPDNSSSVSCAPSPANQPLVDFLQAFGNSYPPRQPQESFPDNLKHSFWLFRTLLTPVSQTVFSQLFCSSSPSPSSCPMLGTTDRGYYCCLQSFITDSDHQCVKTYHDPSLKDRQDQCNQHQHYCCYKNYDSSVNSKQTRYTARYQEKAIDWEDPLISGNAPWWKSLRDVYQALSRVPQAIRLASCYEYICGYQYGTDQKTVDSVRNCLRMSPPNFYCKTNVLPKKSCFQDCLEKNPKDFSSFLWDVLFDVQKPDPGSCGDTQDITSDLLQNTASGGFLNVDGSVKIPKAAWDEAKAHIKAFLEGNDTTSSYDPDYLFRISPSDRTQPCSAFPR